MLFSKIIEILNRLIDLQGFFNKIVVCFIFINIFAFVRVKKQLM